jgi:beta-lactamase superfamily II metal-dependent hydrolase
MSSKKPKQYLVILDVGHGSAAVLHDEGGTVVFDTGKGAHVGRHLNSAGVKQIQCMLLSHADADHIGGAVTLLLNATLNIEEVLLNSDASKNSAIFEQLCYALAEANLHRKTKIDRRLTTSTQIERKGARIEVLHPPDAIALSGVGGKSKSGRQHSSNSMSAAIRVSCGVKSSVLLAGDIEFDCLDGWTTRKVLADARVLVFPHHGGLPGTSDKSEAALFGFELTRMVSPEVVVFSNHRTKFANPRDEVIAAIAKAVGGIRFACTQLPDRLHQHVETNELWAFHKGPGNKGIIEGSICLEFDPSGVRVCFGETP